MHQKLITANGKTRPINEWATQLGVSPGVIRSRIHNGWSDEAAVTTPKRVQTEKADKQPRKPRETRLVAVQGFTGTIREVAEHFGVNAATLRSRIDAAWPEDKLLGKVTATKLQITPYVDLAKYKKFSKAQVQTPPPNLLAPQKIPAGKMLTN